MNVPDVKNSMVENKELFIKSAESNPNFINTKIYISEKTEQ